ncbi:MAG: (4Fe-4S)-binding protein [Nitrospinota bacterium]
MSIVAIEIVYRGIFQKQLAGKISRALVFAARKSGKIGISFGRYGDSPERNGIPAKQFAYIAESPEELEEVAAQYEPKSVDVSIVVDDTLCKGVESWGWYGLQPINALTKEKGVLLITSKKSADDLIPQIHKKDVAYQLCIVDGEASFAGLWVYKNDHTDARVLGAVAKVCPQLAGLPAVEATIRENLKDDDALVESAHTSYEDARLRTVNPGEGDAEEPFRFDQPGWKNMEEALVVRGIEVGGGFHGEEGGGYQPGRNPYFKKWSTRTMRPVINFATCTKCTLCWIACPDSCFDVTADFYYDANMESCCGCGVCDQICPVEECIVMVNETAFSDRESQFEMYKENPQEYEKWRAEVVAAGRVENRNPVTGLSPVFGGLPHGA